MSVHFSIENISFRLDERRRIKRWIDEVVRKHEKEVGEISYKFCNDEDVLEANISFLHHNTYTDIITFDYVEGNVVSGDILISVDRVRENAQIFAVPFQQELHRVIIHGVLHLLGYGDKSEKEASKMRQLEDEALKLLEKIA